MFIGNFAFFLEDADMTRKWALSAPVEFGEIINSRYYTLGALIC